MGLLLSAFAICNHTDKQENKQTNNIIFSYIQAPGLHMIEYYNIYKTVIIYNDDRTINYKNYLQSKFKRDLVHQPCGTMTHKENLDQGQNHF